MVILEIKLFFVLSNFWKIINYLCQNFNKNEKIQLSGLKHTPSSIETQRRGSLDTLDQSTTCKENFVYYFVQPLHAKNFRIKKPSVEVKIQNLINYFIVCCQNHLGAMVSTLISVINVTHIICEQCFYTSLSVIIVNNLNSALTLIQA